MSPFNRAAWDGEKPLVEPMPTPLTVGCLAWEKTPDGADERYERQGGMVVARTVDHATGEVESVTVIDGTRRHGRFQVRRRELAANTVDRATVEPATTDRLYRFAGGCCRHIGDHTIHGARIVGHERWLLEVAVELVALGAEMAAEASQARRDAKGEVA